MITGTSHHFLGSPTVSPILITAEHSGNEVPPELGSLGIDESEFSRHIGYDLGIQSVVHHLHRMSGYPTLLGRYSRLVADMNRPEDSPECIIETSDGTHIPGNTGLTSTARQERIERYYRPFRRAFAELITQASPKRILSVHSFTPMLRTEGLRRPWHCAILYGPETGLASCCIGYLRGISGMIVGDNQPYKLGKGTLMIPRHANGSAIPAVVVEIRQDLIESDADQKKWAEILHGLLKTCFVDSGNR